MLLLFYHVHKEEVINMILATLLLIVALLSVVSVIRQVKIKNYFALAFSAIAALCFGFFSIMTIICDLTQLGICTL